jgi:CMP-N,N'-diacetyllegionaminic acid synthase
MTDTLALIPARAGSVGLPGKNRRMLAGMPMFMHSVECARRVPSVRSILVSTDDVELASLATEAGVPVPEMRPAELSTGTTPMADVVRYAVDRQARAGESDDAFLLLLDPTSPCREPSVIEESIDRLRADPTLDGVVSVSVPVFNPLWVGVTVDGTGRIGPHPLLQETYVRRQDVPEYWRINGSFYVWRMDYARSLTPDWTRTGRILAAVTPELLSHSIDTEEDALLVEALLDSGVVRLDWLKWDGNDVAL